jgi:hypothetical protein
MGFSHEFYEYLFSPASPHSFGSITEYEHALSSSKKIKQRHHRISFTHEDFKAHNVLVDDDGLCLDFSIGNL